MTQRLQVLESCASGSVPHRYVYTLTSSRARRQSRDRDWGCPSEQEVEAQRDQGCQGDQTGTIDIYVLVTVLQYTKILVSGACLWYYSCYTTSKRLISKERRQIIHPFQSTQTLTVFCRDIPLHEDRVPLVQCLLHQRHLHTVEGNLDPRGPRRRGREGGQDGGVGAPGEAGRRGGIEGGPGAAGVGLAGLTAALQRSEFDG